MSALPRSRALVGLLCVALANQACTTLHDIGLPEDAGSRPAAVSGQIAVGDRVRIITRDGVSHDLRVTDLQESHIDGGHQRIELREIQALAKRKFSPGKTTAILVVAGVVLVAGIVAVVANQNWGGLVYASSY